MKRHPVGDDGDRQLIVSQRSNFVCALDVRVKIPKDNSRCDCTGG